MQYPEKLALTVPDAVKASGLGRASIYRAIHDGKLIVRRFGKRTLILREELEAFLRSLPTGVISERAPAYRKKQAAAKVAA